MEQASFLDAPKSGRCMCCPGSAGLTPVQDSMEQGSLGPWKIRGTFSSFFLEASVPQSISFLLSFLRKHILLWGNEIRELASPPHPGNHQSRGEINKTAHMWGVGNGTVPPLPNVPHQECMHLHVPPAHSDPHPQATTAQVSGAPLALVPRLSDICITNRVAFGTVFS